MVGAGHRRAYARRYTQAQEGRGQACAVARHENSVDHLLFRNKRDLANGQQTAGHRLGFAEPGGEMRIGPPHHLNQGLRTSAGCFECLARREHTKVCQPVFDTRHSAITTWKQIQLNGAPAIHAAVVTFDAHELAGPADKLAA